MGRTNRGAVGKNRVGGELQGDIGTAAIEACLCFTLLAVSEERTQIPCFQSNFLVILSFWFG